MNCAICGNAYRSKATLVYVAEGGALVRKRACPTCVGRGIMVVPSDAATRCKCGGMAMTCGLCVSKKELAAKKGGADANKLAKTLDGMASAYKDQPAEPADPDYTDGYVAGMEAAATYLRSGRW